MAEKNEIGARLRAVRESRSIKTEELAERASVPLELLTQIEAGATIPSLAPLVKIARALGVRLGTFMDDHEEIGPVVTRKAERKPTTHFAGKGGVGGAMDFHALAATKAGRHMDPFFIDIHPESRKDAEISSHEGEEFIYVLSGKVEIVYGKDTTVLSEGDSIYYDSIVAHAVRCADDKPAVILACVYAPY